ncbi:MAG: pentapeptide repeat-containing protein [Pirellulales bacterium]
MRHVLAALVTLALVLGTAVGHADIFRWDDGTVVPGTKGLTLSPGVSLSGRNSEDRNLRFANFSGLDLHGAHFDGSWLHNAHFVGTDLTKASFDSAVLLDADFTDASVAGANFMFFIPFAEPAGLAPDQLYATKSYHERDLKGINFRFSVLSGWNFAGQDLVGAGFWSANLTDANLAAANLTGAFLAQATLKNANFQGANLTGANLGSSNLRDATLAGAVVTGAHFGWSNDYTPPPNTVIENLAQAQLYSTKSYQDKHLQGVALDYNDLTGWSFADQDLSDAVFSHATLRTTNLLGATVVGADFSETTARGFLGAQLYSTLSYQSKSLRGIRLDGNDLSDWSFKGQDLSNASFAGAHLTYADVTGAVVNDGGFQNTTSRGFSWGQLVTTQSYQDKNLAGIDLSSNDLNDWDFAGQDLGNANLSSCDLTSANLTGANLMGAFLTGSTLAGADLSVADLRGAKLPPNSGANLRNSVLNTGSVKGLDLNAGERLVVRDDDGVSSPPLEPWLTTRSPIRVTIRDHLTMAGSGVLELRFDADLWDSLISFQAGIPVQLGGKLDLTFAKGADPATQVGHTLHLFDWSGVSPTGAFTVSSLYDWDLSCLYTTGEVTLLAAGGVIAGDVNGDGRVDTADFGTLKDHFGAAGSKAAGDANGDGKIDLSDFGLLKANFGKSGAASVPEPSALAHVGGALALIGAWLANRHRLFKSPVPQC